VTKQIDLSIYSQSGTKLVACAAYSFIHTSVDGGNTWSTHADVGVRDWTGVRWVCVCVCVASVDGGNTRSAHADLGVRDWYT